MTSERRIRAARANGALGRGCKTPEGLIRSAANSVTHDLTSQNLVLSNEEEADYQKLRELCLAELKPLTPFEAALVDQVIASHWRLERAVSIETALVDLEMNDQRDKIEKDFATIDGDSRLAIAFRALDNSGALAHIARYEAHCLRAANRALQTLLTLRAAQKQKKGDYPVDIGEQKAYIGHGGLECAGACETNFEEWA